MGLTNLESLDELIACNHANYRAYARGTWPASPGCSDHFPTTSGIAANYQYVVTLDAPADARVRRATSWSPCCTPRT